MNRDEFERCRRAIGEATAALNAHLDAIDASIFISRRSPGSSPVESAAPDRLPWLDEYERLVRIRDKAEAELARHL
jgi:hypothetical protein